MKKLLLALILFSYFVSPVVAADVPHCWDQSDDAQFVDGSFIISVHTKDMTKVEILEVLDMANGRYIHAKNYPVVLGDILMITIQATDSGIGEHRLSRPELMSAVNEELEAIVAYDGISMSCNYYVYPR